MVLSCLIDNSTISSVQRIIGDIPISRSHDIEGDLSAFEQFVISILFHDDVIVVDDYKAEHRDARRKLIPFARHFRGDDRLHTTMTEMAYTHSSDILLSMRGTNVLPNEVGRFLERIGLYLTAAWIMTSSEWFLNLRLLAAPDEYSDRYKYSKLTTSIFDQLSKGGDPYERGARLTSFEEKSAESLIRENENLHISAQLQDFVSNINWLTLRSVFYVGYANYYGYSLCLHPIRHCFLSSYFESGVSGSSDPSVSSLVNFFTNKSSDALKKFDEDTMCPNVGLQLPWITAWLLGKHRSPKKALSAAYELRDHPRLQKVRRRFSEIFEIQGNTVSLKSKKGYDFLTK